MENTINTLFDYTRFAIKKRGNSKRDILYNKFSNKIILNEKLNRSLVSYQDNKSEPFYRWFKFKEGFSSKLIKYLINHYIPTSNKRLNILDPFAGSGTTLTTSIKLGHYATGIELLPVGIAAMKARLIADTVDLSKFEIIYNKLVSKDFLDQFTEKYKFPHIKITEKAFPPETERQISKYLTFLNSIEDEKVRYLFWFACLAILEEISYTSKDGQYLRWDYRSERNLNSKFRKKTIKDFKSAITEKLNVIFNDLKIRNGGKFIKNAKIIEGSCLEELPLIPDNSFDLVITSPPYCNRYDYTRIYALELAFLGYDEYKVKKLRQALLSSTVENRPKLNELISNYKKQNRENFFKNITTTFDQQDALQEIIDILQNARQNKKLNNNNIPTMVENYFFEMNIIIHEVSRILTPGGRVYMVNDNVQYMGEEIPVDLILSDFAEKAGLVVDYIWILPKGKGNSSQQMGQYGRNEIRKGIYVWSKP